MNNATDKFIQANSPDGGFLQSQEWRKFQESYGRKTFNVVGENFWANIIEHHLPIVGSYFYIPRGPIVEMQNTNLKMENDNVKFKNYLTELVDLAKKEKAGWIRIEPADNNILENIIKGTGCNIVKAPHDMQPREIFLMDLRKPEEQLHFEMKSKTRYNIRLSQKRGVSVKVISNQDCHLERSETESKDLIVELDSSASLGMTNFYFDKFIELVEITSKRNGISAHPEEYYRKMWETLPAENLKLYVAEHEGKIIAANLVLYYGQFATYLHGTSDNDFREVMAPYLLQWQAIRDAKASGCEKYDFGGISTKYLPAGRQANPNPNKFAGITRFKLGFAPGAKPIEFPGSYDIIINSGRYYIYRTLQFIKNILQKK